MLFYRGLENIHLLWLNIFCPIHLEIGKHMATRTLTVSGWAFQVEYKPKGEEGHGACIEFDHKSIEPLMPELRKHLWIYRNDISFIDETVNDDGKPIVRLAFTTNELSENLIRAIVVPFLETSIRSYYSDEPDDHPASMKDTANRVRADMASRN